MKKNFKASVIIPFYNCKFIDRAIESVLLQTYSNIEIIVVNDGATKYTELIEPYLSEIRYIKKENGGTASALNLGIKNATGDYFCWLSSDDLYDQKKIEIQLQYMIENNASISFTNFNTIDSKSKIINANIAPIFATKTDFYKEFMKSCPINGSTVMLKMDVFQKAGLFNESYYYTHDYEFWMRLTQFYEFNYLNITLVNTRIHNEMGSIKNNEELLKQADYLRENYKPIFNRIIKKGENYKPLIQELEMCSEKVSIIIPFYNCPFVDQAINSALNQTYKNVEVIVVNDGSTMYEDKLTPYLEKIKYITKKNGGTASALNSGIKNATGKYFAWLSSDDIFYLNKVERQIEFMKSKNAYISYTPVININSNSFPISKSVGVNYPDKLHFLKGMRNGCTINGCTVMVKMELFEEIGVFNESLLYTQDYDLWLRAIPRYEFYYLDEPLVLYRFHEGMGTKRFMDKKMIEDEKVQQKHKDIINNLIYEEEKRKND